MRNSSPVLEAAASRVVVIDGAMGTEIQKVPLTSADFGGTDGLNEMLVLSRPDVITRIHESFLEAGADIIETDSFSANRIVLAEYGIPEMAASISQAAASLARAAADRWSVPGRPRFVSGSVGPGSRLPSLGQVEPEEMQDAYREQAVGLLDGGVDLFQVETCQDPLQCRLALMGLAQAMELRGRHVPIFCQVTVDRAGRMLGGTDVTAAFATVSAMPGVSAFGLNCSTGPDAMLPVLSRLSRTAWLPLAALPNAGLPENDGGRLVYRLSPADFAAQARAFVIDCGVAFVGGCCGTTPEHIRELASAVDGLVPRMPTESDLSNGPGVVSSLFSAVPLIQEPGPLIIGEATNANGSKAFRDYLVSGDLEGMLAVGRGQVEEGAHILDVCLAVAGRDEAADVRAFVPLAGRLLDAPLMIDSTEPAVIQAALMRCPGRAVVNSVNLEDGGARLDEIARIARRHGAAVVGLTIDESGMAMTAAGKFDVACRIVERLRVHGIQDRDILLDPLTFTMASGDASLRSSAVETIEAVRMIKSGIPKVLTSLGVSNCSYGLKPPARRVLNSVMLHHCMQAGLDAAIINSRKILPLSSIPVEMRQAASDLILDRRTSGRDPLQAFIEMFEVGISMFSAETTAGEACRDPVERCRRAVIRGERAGLDEVILELAGRMGPLDVINGVLLDAMRQVGDLFGRGEMQLPFVLRSAAVMKDAVQILEPLLATDSRSVRGTLVLATVAGDVHDIGKNLVDIIISNNGYRVVNLGIRQTADEIMQAAVREKADAVGMSGLLVRSTLAMKDNLVAMDRAGFSIPVLVGGAALDIGFVREQLKPSYRGHVEYCRDAFEGLKALDALLG